MQATLLSNLETQSRLSRGFRMQVAQFRSSGALAASAGVERRRTFQEHPFRGSEAARVQLCRFNAGLSDVDVPGPKNSGSGWKSRGVHCDPILVPAMAVHPMYR